MDSELQAWVTVIQHMTPEQHRAAPGWQPVVELPNNPDYTWVAQIPDCKHWYGLLLETNVAPIDVYLAPKQFANTPLHGTWRWLTRITEPTEIPWLNWKKWKNDDDVWMWYSARADLSPWSLDETARRDWCLMVVASTSTMAGKVFGMYAPRARCDV